VFFAFFRGHSQGSNFGFRPSDLRA
jgi:hypothetical protein